MHVSSAYARDANIIPRVATVFVRRSGDTARGAPVQHLSSLLPSLVSIVRSVLASAMMMANTSKDADLYPKTHCL